VNSDVADNISLCYDLSKGLLQFVFGFYGDRIGRKNLVVGGLATCSLALVIWAITGSSATSSSGAATGFSIAATILGVGTSMMYSSVIAAVAEQAHPSWRASAVGSYRFWRDSGFAFGGLILGSVTDSAGIVWAVVITAIFTLVVAITFYFVYTEHYEGALDMTELSKKAEKDTASK
jgi:MFS family permease